MSTSGFESLLVGRLLWVLQREVKHEVDHLRRKQAPKQHHRVDSVEVGTDNVAVSSNHAIDRTFSDSFSICHWLIRLGAEMCLWKS